jgi:phage protein D
MRMRAQGHTSLRALATELDAAGMQTRRGGRWHVSTVRSLLARIDRLQGLAAAQTACDVAE